MTNMIKHLLSKKGWWKGEVRIPYNLMWALIILGILLLPVVLVLVIVAAILYGLWWLVCKVLNWLIAFWRWLCPYLAAFWAWLRGLFHRKPREKKQEEKKEKKNWWWLLLLLLLLMLLLLGLFKWCSGKEETTPAVPEQIAYQTAWNDALYARVFLDGLREDATLAGYKYRDGKPAKDADFNGDAANEAWCVMYEEWLPILQNNITVELMPDQKVAAWLYALRSGKYGFAKSDFVKFVNAGDMAKAGEALMKIHKANGQVREAGDELQSYLYTIRLIWDGKISIEELKDCHCFSYKAYPVTQGYQPQELVDVIKTKNPLNAQTPRELLDGGECPD